MQAVKCLVQNYQPSNEILLLLNEFRKMVNDCIRIGLSNNAATLKRLSQLSYNQLARYNLPSYYKLCGISRAAGILASRKKSIKRGIRTKNPYAVKPSLTSCYGFKLSDDRSMLIIPIGNRPYFTIKLNKYTRQILSDPALRVRSFTLTATKLSICYSKQVAEIECTKTAGIDRNLRNVTYGNDERMIQFDITKAVEISKNTNQIVASFKRNDARVRKKISVKYGIRRRNRINQLLHKVSKHIVSTAEKNREAIVFEKMKGIRKLYKRGNGQGRKYRAKMNSWTFYELERQVTYKAKWDGIPLIHIDAKGTSNLCPRCGERLQSDRRYERMLWCNKCARFMDRDIVAAMNLAHRAAEVRQFEKGEAVEAMRGNPKTVILRVDASKVLPTVQCRIGSITR